MQASPLAQPGQPSRKQCPPRRSRAAAPPTLPPKHDYKLRAKYKGPNTVTRVDTLQGHCPPSEPWYSGTRPGSQGRGSPARRLQRLGSDAACGVGRTGLPGKSPQDHRPRPPPHPPHGPPYRWEGVPPECTLSGSVVAAEARDRLEPDWARLRWSAGGRGELPPGPPRHPPPSPHTAARAPRLLTGRGALGPRIAA